MITIEDFVGEARAFLEQHSTLKDELSPFVWGEGPDEVSLFAEFDGAELDASKHWAAVRFDAGFGWIDGPLELGGRGLTTDHTKAYAELESRYDIPDMSPMVIAQGFVGPTILAHGTRGLSRELLPAMYRGDVIACQLFSEPNAGSDLAAAQTRAVRDGDEWVINGQKVWTSNAHIADVGIAVTRTDPSAPKHRGITIFMVDMHAAGVDVRPLRQMTGGAGFNEVFLTDVRVPDEHRLGDVNMGFNVIITTLGNERAVQMRSADAHLPGPFERFVGLVEHLGDRHDPLVRQRLASLYAHEKINTWLMDGMAAGLERGETPGAEMSLLKLAAIRYLDEAVQLVSQVLGPRLVADDGEWGTFGWSTLVLGRPGAGIGGGTSEIVRNTLGERVLGLPKERPPAQSADPHGAALLARTSA